MKKTALFLMALSIFSCQSDDESIPTAQYSEMSYSYRNMFYPTMVDGDPLGQVKIKMINGAVVRRLGGLRPLDPATGYSYLFDDSAYDDVEYSGNRIRVKKGMVLIYYTQPNTITDFLVDANGRITHKVTVHDNGFQTPGDTLKYTYDQRGLLTGAQRKVVSYLRETTTFYYNAQKNLDSIVWREIYQGDQVQKAIVEKFSEYDRAPNPLRKLFIFDETFLRSLSINNFMKYERWEIQNANSNETYYDQRVWDIPHDANGNIVF